MSKQVYMVLDYETYSECDLKKAGAFEYATHDTTEILCLAYKIGTKSTLMSARARVLTSQDWEQTAIDQAFARSIANPDVKLVAHNALFEIVITKFVLTKIGNLLGSKLCGDVALSRWIDTASLAAASGLPRSLDGAGSALSLPVTKDMAGHKAMLKLSKPRKPTKNNDATRWTRDSAREDYKTLAEYCAKDVDVCAALFCALPELSAKEQLNWEHDQELNLRGFACDRKLVANALGMIEIEKARLDRLTQKLSGGEVSSARQRDAFLKCLQRSGVKVANLQSETLEQALKKPLPDKAKQLIGIRLQSSKSSTAKYEAFGIGSRFDGRIRDTTVYYGAHTGRQAGRRLQPQNLFRNVLAQDDLELGIDLMERGDLPAVQALYDKPMDLFASALRSCIVAPKGYVLEVGDFSMIEVRVLFWLAGHEAGLQAFRDGKDLYVDMASKIYNVCATDLERRYKEGDTQAGEQRTLGKQAVLGCGFGIGVNGKKFYETALSYGMKIDVSLAQKAVLTYRRVHQPVPRMWSALERAATQAVMTEGKVFKTCKIAFKKSGDWLLARLPSGRVLRYFKPALKRVQTLYGDRLELRHHAVNSTTGQFEQVKTWGGTLTENVVQAVARDLLYDARARCLQVGMKPVLMVHDEIVCETQEGAPLKLEKIMNEAPTWCHELPLKVSAYTATRYKK